MADNVAITAGTGTTIAADDIGGVLHQRVKISQGVDGSATDVSSAAPLQVTLANTGANTNKILVTPDLPSGAATAAKQPALGTAGTASADVLTVQGKAAMTPLLVDGSATTQPVSGTFWQATQPVSGTVTATGTVTANMGTVTADPFGANADAASATGSISAKLRFIASTGIPITGTVTVGSHAVTNAGTFAVQAASAGDVASGSSDSGNPVKVGGLGKTANPTAVTDGQRTNFLTDKLGKQVVVNSIRDLKGMQSTTITSSTAETTIVTAVASTFCDLYGLILTNTSATTTKVTIKDSTAGTTRAVIEVPPTETRGFMLTESAALPQATVNTNWTATCGTSVSAVEIAAFFVKNI